jgi:hypothetical protein
VRIIDNYLIICNFKTFFSRLTGPLSLQKWPPPKYEVVRRSSIFWDVTPCSPVKTRKQREEGSKQNKHDVISQKKELFIVTAVRSQLQHNYALVSWPSA